MGKGSKRKGTKKTPQRKRETSQFGNANGNGITGGEEDGCNHIHKAVKLQAVQNTFPHWKIGDCKDCGKISNDESTPDKKTQKEAAGICICLHCGHQGCSRQSEHQHAHDHYLNTTSHTINVNLKTWVVWCYACDKEINIGAEVTGLYKSVRYLRIKLSEASKTGNTDAQNAANFNSATDVKDGSKGMTQVKGLKNLGNTCFFNSVMQNIMRTPILRNSLDAAIGVNRNEQISFKNSTLVKLAITISDPPGPLTQALRNLLDEVNASSQRIMSPGRLFGEISKKAPQFRGYRQQDSQELLRYLLDGMRTEELQRIEGGLRIAMKELGSDKRPDKDEIKANMKAMKTFVDDIFGGMLVSTVTCQECYTTSQSYEAFLDLSLSVAAAQEITLKDVAKRKASKPKPNNECENIENEFLDESEKLCNKEKALSKHQKKVNARKDRKAKKGKGKNSHPDSSADCQLDEYKEEKCKTSEGDAISNKLEIEEAIEICEDSSSGRETPLLANIFSEDDTEGSQCSDQSVNQDRKEENQEIIQQNTNLKGGDPTIFQSNVDVVTAGSNISDRHLKNVDDMKQCAVELCSNLNKILGISPGFQNYKQLNPNCVIQEKNCCCNSKDVDTDCLCCANNYVSDSECHDNEVNDQSCQRETIAGHSAETIDICTISDGTEGTAGESTNISMSFEQLKLEDAINDKECCERPVENCTDRRPDCTGEVPTIAVCDQDVNVNDVTEMLSEAKIDDDDDVKEENDITDLEAEKGTSNQVDMPTTDVPLVHIDYNPKPGECSIMTCLQQFCKTENLDGHNKFGCGTCFKRRRKDSTGSSRKEQTSSTKGQTSSTNEQTSSTKEQTSCKTKNIVFTKATKQFLIHNPPKILTLHLKRFQQTGNNLRKINKHIEFPLLLDLAPFCHKDTLEKVNNLQYSLYGLVEHSGSLHGGHYVAHVKVKPSAAEMKPKWYYVSDTQVSEAQQETVLRKQAYLLFYEKKT